MRRPSLIRSATAFSSKSREDMDNGAGAQVVRSVEVEGRVGGRKAWARGRRERTREEGESFMVG